MAKGATTRGARQSFSGLVLGEVLSSRQVLRGCACGTPHPLACNPPQPTLICPGCGLCAAPPEAVIRDRAQVIDVRTRFGMALLGVGRLLMKLSQRI